MKKLFQKKNRINKIKLRQILGGGVFVLFLLYSHVLSAQIGGGGTIGGCPDGCTKDLEDNCVCPCDIDAIYNAILWAPPTLNIVGSKLIIGNEIVTGDIVNASSLFANGTTVSNKSIEIHAQFIVDIDLKFVDCDIYVESEQGINVLSNRSFEVSGSYFHSSYILWSGIYTNPFSSLIIEDSYIQDAYFAVHANPRAKISIIDTRFNKNLVGVRVYDIGSNEVANASTALFRNHFNCTGDLLLQGGNVVEDNFVLKWCKKSYAAILSEYTLHMRHGRTDCNQFSSITNHANGILMYGATLYASNIKMVNITDNENDCNYNTEGVGYGSNLPNLYVSYFGDVLDVIGWELWTEDNTFENVDIAVSCANGTMDISKCIIQGGNTGIRGQRQSGAKIYNNEIKYPSLVGIELLQGSTRSFSIKYNNVSIDEDANGIFANDVSGGGYDTQKPESKISKNTITHRGSGVGIMASGCRSVAILENTINQPNASYETNPSSTATGIQVSAGANNIVFKNKVTNQAFGKGKNEPAMTGIQYLRSEKLRNLIQCNTTTSLDQGFEWINKSELQIESNYSNQDILGWHYTEHAVTGVQSQTNNRWESYTADGQLNDAIHDDMASTIFVEMSVIETGPNGFPTVFDPLPTNPNGLVALFDFYSPSVNCPSYNSLNLEPIVLSPGDSIIAIDGATGTSFPGAFKWVAKLDLYEKIAGNGINVPSGSVYETFINDSKMNGISDYYDARLAVYEALDVDASDSLMVSDNQDDLDGRNNLIYNIDQQYLSGTIPYSSWISQRSVYNSQSKNYDDIFSSDLNTIESSVATKLSTAKTDIINLTTSNYLNTEIKKSLDLYVDHKLDNLSGSDESYVLGFTGACLEQYYSPALTYGTIAHNLLETYNYVINCDSMANTFRSIDYNAVKAYPNPAMDVLNIEFNQEYEGDLSIFSAEGVKMKSYSLTKVKFDQLDISFLPSGVYIIQFEQVYANPIKFIKQ